MSRNNGNLRDDGENDLLTRILAGDSAWEPGRQPRKESRGEPARADLDPTINAQLLRILSADPLHQQQLRRLLYDHGYGRPTTSLDPTRLPEVLSGWLAEGRPDLAAPVLRDIPVSARSLYEEPAPAEEEPADAPHEEVTTHWLRIRAVDDETQGPLAGIKLRIKPPGLAGSVYTTNRDGEIYLDNLSAGVADIERMLDDEALEVVRVE